MKKVISFILVLAMCTSLYVPAYATSATTTEKIEAKIEENIENSTSIRINWWTIGFKLVKVVTGLVVQWYEETVDLDPISEYNSNYVYLVSPDYDFNTGSDGNEFYFKPEVNDDVYFFRMHGHRVVAVDIFSKLNLILSDSNNDSVSTDVTTTNEYMFYDRAASDPSGVWKAQFISSDSYKWQLYYAHYYDTGETAALTNVEQYNDELGFYYGPNSRVFHYISADYPAVVLNSINENTLPLNMTNLNNQFIDLTTGATVDYLRDYNVGDALAFSDTIVNLEYNEESDSTTFYFEEENSDELIGWKFRGNYTTDYSAGDVLSLNFLVVNVGEYNDYVFESLDYFEEVRSMDTDSDLPYLNEYLATF